MTTTPTSRTAKVGVVGREGAGRLGHDLLLRQAARDRQQRNDHQEAPDQHRDADASGCSSGVLAVMPAKAEPLLPVADV